MSIKFYLQLLCKVVVLIIVCFLLAVCSNTKSPEQTVIFVKVPPFYDKKFSDYGNYLRFQDFLFPPKGISKDEISYPKAGDKQGLPNDDSILEISINEKGEITLNLQNEGNVLDTTFLIEHLKTIFRKRAEAGVYEEGSRKIFKAVGIKTAGSVKYGDFIKIVDAVKQSGADPIVLRFKDDAGNFENYFKK